MVQSLFEAGLDVPPIGQLVARTNDALCRALLRFAEDDLGPPPCPYAFIVFGSEGRMEQTLLTDQDNALVYADDSEKAASYFPDLARRVAADLAAAGVPPCAGGYMATAWQGPLSTWQGRFGSWIDLPTGEAMLHVANFFDFRKAFGELDLASLESIVASAKGHDRFRAMLLAEGLRFRPPLGAFGRLRGTAEGIDLKKNGLVPIVTLARVYALEAGSAERGTLERLAGARAAGILSADGSEELSEAFRFFLRLRLREQLRGFARGEPPTGRLHPDALSSLERARLKESFRAVQEAQDAAALRYRTDRF
jgi:CBS domain-containing protein